MSFILLGILNSQETAAAGGPAYDLIETTTATSGGSITFSNVNNLTDYKHLQIRYVARGTEANTGGTIGIRLNGVTASDYSNHSITGDPSTSGSADFTTYFFANDTIPLGSSTTSAFGVGIIEFTDFLSTSKHKVIRAWLGNQALGGTRNLYLTGMLRNTTAAISSINLFILGTSGNYATGTRFSLYGIKG